MRRTHPNPQLLNSSLPFLQDVRKPGGGAWVAPADRRAMTAVEPFDVGLATLSKLHPVRFVLSPCSPTQQSPKGRQYGPYAHHAQHR
jgi:hypothetical protein